MNVYLGTEELYALLEISWNRATKPYETIMHTFISEWHPYLSTQERKELYTWATERLESTPDSPAYKLQQLWLGRFDPDSQYRVSYKKLATRCFKALGQMWGNSYGTFPLDSVFEFTHIPANEIEQVQDGTYWSIAQSIREGELEPTLETLTTTYGLPVDRARTLFEELVENGIASRELDPPVHLVKMP